MAQLTLRDLLARYRLWDEAQDVLPTVAQDWVINVEDEALNLDSLGDDERARRTLGMPHLLAYAYEQMHQAKHPIIKISWMVNLTELCVRWSAALLIADLTARFCGRGELILPSWAQEIVRHHIRRPTLGSWVHILRELTRAFRQRVERREINQALWGLHGRINEHFSRDDASLLSARNRFAHDGISPDRARDEWESASPKIESLISEVTQATRRGVKSAEACQLLALYQGELYSLMGVELTSAPLSDQAVSELFSQKHRERSIEEALISQLREKRDAVYLMSETGEPLLLPYFVLFGGIERLAPHDELGEPKSRNVAQIYAKLDQDRAVFTPINCDEVVTYHEDMQSFETFLGLHVESTLSSVSGYTCEEYVLGHPTSYKSDFSGRNRELDVLTYWLFQPTDDLRADSQPSVLDQVAWLGGGAGIGKSHLLSTLAYQLHNKTHQVYERSLFADRGIEYNELPSCPVFYHRFELGDPRCDLDICLRLLAQKLHQSFALQLAQDPEERFHELEYLERSGSDLEEYLESILLYLTPPVQDQLDAHFMIILDAVDLLDLSRASELNDESRPLALLIDLLAQLTRVSALQLRVIISTSSATPPRSSAESVPTLALAQYRGLSRLLESRLRRVGANPHAARAIQGALDDLRRLDSGLLPPLSDQSVRQLFLQASEGAYSSAINELGKSKRDIRDNPFLRAVIERSQGSPLYLRLVLDELESGRLVISHAPNLPNGVEAYFFNMLQRVTFGDATRNLPLVLCLLLIARRALSESALTQLVFKSFKPSSRERRQVGSLLHQMTHLFMRQRREGISYWQFQDPALRSVLTTRSTGEDAPAGPPQLSSTYHEALERIAYFSERWERLSDIGGDLTRHLFEFDLDYTKLLNTSRATSSLIKRISQLSYLIKYVEHNTPERVAQLPDTYGSLRRLARRQALKLPDDDFELLSEWERFFRQNQSILGRALPGGASQALIQLALDDAQRSVISDQARQWMKENPESFSEMRLASRSRKAEPLTSSLCYTQTLGDTVRSIAALSAEHFVCSLGSSSSSAPSEIIVYSVQRGRALWRYTAQRSHEIFEAVVLKRLDPDQSQGACQLALWSSAQVELVNLTLGRGQCVASQDESSPKSLPLPEGKLKLTGCLKVSERCVMAWQTSGAYVWDWSGDRLSSFSFKVKKIREVIRLDDHRVLAHQGKPIQALSWDVETGESEQTQLLTLDQTYEYGSLKLLNDHALLAISAKTKSAPPRIDLITLDASSLDDLLDHAQAEPEIGRVETLIHPHSSWINGVVIAPQDLGHPGQTPRFYTSDAHLIARWSASTPDAPAPHVDLIASCPLTESAKQSHGHQRGVELTEDLALEMGAELKGGRWIDESPVWYGRQGALVVFHREREWLTLDKRHDQGHQTAISQLEPHHGLLISASEDNDLRLWSITEGEIMCRGLWRGHNDRVNHLILLESAQPTEPAHLSLEMSAQASAEGGAPPSEGSKTLHLVSSDVGKQLSVWRYDLPTLARTLKYQERQLPFIKSAICLGQDRRYVLTGHQGLLLTLWDDWGARRVAQCQISGEPGESAVTHLYPLAERQGGGLDDASLNDTGLVITHKSKRSYLYHLPSLTCAGTLPYPRTLHQHLLIQDAPEGPLLLTIFDREGARHPADRPRHSHELWTWSLKHQLTPPEEDCDPPTLTPWVFTEHHAPIMGVKRLAGHRVFSWDEAGEAIMWDLRAEKGTPTLSVKRRLSLFEVLTAQQGSTASHSEIAEKRSARKIKLKVSPNLRRVLVWNDTHASLLKLTSRGDQLKVHRLKVTLPQISEVHFAYNDLLLISARRVGVSLYDVSGQRASAKYTLNEAPFYDISRLHILGEPKRPEGLMIYERRRKNHVWRWRWSLERAQREGVGEGAESGASLELIHKDQSLADLSAGLVYKTAPYVEIQNEQIALYRPGSGQVVRWYNTDGTLWSVVELCDTHLILKMNRALYPLVLPQRLSET